ncbi:MAG: ATP-grasp domain-containing protein [Planctomycetota bacterium]
MYYVILDPGHDYPAYMVEFLAQHDCRGIAVFTAEDQYHTFHHLFEEELGDYFVDEYLASEFPEVQSLAEQILQDWGTLDGIIPWSEFTIEFGAELGEYLGIDWNPLEVIHRFRNKYYLKEFLRKNTTDLRINASRIVTTEEEAVAFQQELNKWPIVVKPTEGGGSKNVFFVNTMEELIESCVQVFHGKQGEVLLEEYLGGIEYVVNGITNSDYDVLITDVWRYDKRDSHGYKNLYYETIKVNTNEAVFQPLATYAGKVIETLELRKSPFHMELKFDEYGPCLVEVGARFAGGNQPLNTSKLHERSLFELAACHYMANLPISLEDLHYDRYDRLQARIINGLQTYEIPCIKAIYGLEEVQQLPSFFRIGFTRPLGSHLGVTKDIYGKSYEVYLMHEDPEQIASDAEAVRQLIRYE